MEENLTRIRQSLDRLIGLHRQLLDTVRMERDSIAQADLTGIQEATCAKEALVEAIRQEDVKRQQLVFDFAASLKKPLSELTLSNIAITVQGHSPKQAEQLRSAYNTLTILIQRIREQSEYNRDLIEKSLEHIREMKKNVLGEAIPNSGTYTSQGQRASGSQGSRLISKEA